MTKKSVSDAVESKFSGAKLFLFDHRANYLGTAIRSQIELYQYINSGLFNTYGHRVNLSVHPKTHQDHAKVRNHSYVHVLQSVATTLDLHRVSTPISKSTALKRNQFISINHFTWKPLVFKTSFQFSKTISHKITLQC